MPPVNTAVTYMYLLIYIQLINRNKLMPFFRPVKTKKRSKRYEKVSHKCRVLLLKKVLCDRSQIKQSAQELEINYSTAKTLMRKYKYHGNEINAAVLEGICSWYAIYEVQRQRCDYKIIQAEDQAIKIEDLKPSTDQQYHKLKQEYIEFDHPLLFTRQLPTSVQILQQVLFKD